MNNLWKGRKLEIHLYDLLKQYMMAQFMFKDLPSIENSFEIQVTHRGPWKEKDKRIEEMCRKYESTNDHDLVKIDPNANDLKNLEESIVRLEDDIASQDPVLFKEMQEKKEDSVFVNCCKHFLSKVLTISLKVPALFEGMKVLEHLLSVNSQVTSLHLTDPYNFNERTSEKQDEMRHLLTMDRWRIPSDQHVSLQAPKLRTLTFTSSSLYLNKRMFDWKFCFEYDCFNAMNHFLPYRNLLLEMFVLKDKTKVVWNICKIQLQRMLRCK